MIFNLKKFHILEKKFLLFFLIEFFNVITAPQTLKGSRNIQGFALIRAVLFHFVPVLQTFEKQRRGSGQVETGVWED